MKDAQFRLLTTMLRSMEDEDSRKADLEGAINHIIKRFDRHLTPEQKNVALKEFLNYEKIRRERKERIKMINKMEEEKHRAALYSFLNGDEISL